MSTNIIEGFEIENDLKITDGQVTISTNDTTVSLDISSNLTIGNIEDNNSNKLIIKNKNKAEINLISKNSLDTESIHKISNKNGGLLFESENSAIDYTRYEFDVGGGESVGIMKASVDNFSGIVFGKNSDEVESIITYNTPHLGYKHDDDTLILTSEKYKFNLSSDNYQTLNAFSSLDINGLSIGTENPINRLSIFGNIDTDVSMCIVAVGDDSYKSSGIWLGTQFSSTSETMTKTAIICDQTGTDGDGTAKLHFCLDDSTDSGDVTIAHSRVTIQPNGYVGIGKISPEKSLDINGDMKVGEINVYDSINIENETNTILLDISGVSAIRIPSGNNFLEKSSMILNSLPGYMRFNTTLSQFEGYDGTNWISLGGVMSLNQTTYIDADNSNGLTFYESNIGKMNIKQGNICFGNADPSYNFHFAGSTNDESRITITNSAAAGTDYLSLQRNDDNSSQLVNTGNGSFTIATNNQLGQNNNDPQLFLSSTSNYVGIGTNNPSGMLFIKDSQEIANNIVLNLFSTDFSTGKSYTILKLEKGAGYGGSVKGFIDQGVSSGLEFSTYNSDTENTVMTILNNGNIGMGYTEPNESLVIQGTNDTWINIVTGSEDKMAGIKFIHNHTSTEYGADSYIDWKIHTGHDDPAVSGSHAEGLFFGKKSSHGTFDQDNVLVLNPYGLVGIGTSSPDRQLDIETTDTGTDWNASLIVGNQTNKFIAGVYNNEVLIGGHNASLNSWRNMRINDAGYVKICTSSGNVGIGNGHEGDPEYKLDLREKNSSVATSWIYLDCANSIANAETALTYDQGESVTSGDAGGGLYWKPYYDVGSNTYSKHSAAIRFRSEGNWFRGGLDFMTNDSMDTSTDCLTRFRIAGNGWTTVGSTAPEGPLSITTSGVAFNSSQTLGIHMGVLGQYTCINMVSDHLGGPWIDFKPTARHGTSYADKHGRLRYAMDHQNGSFLLYTNNSLRYVFNGNGHVGINISSPTYPLQVSGYTSSTNGSAQPYYMWRYGYAAGEGLFTSSGNYEYVSIKSDYAVLADRFVVISDKRIKTNIEEVPDNLSLEKIRKIECKYYDYIDSNVRGTNRTIGFIAQQVREHMPMAVAIVKDFIPDKMCLLKEISWSESDDKFTMSTPELTDVSGVEYRFYVSENTKSDEIIVELTGNSDNTFTFDKQWKVIFCYGKKIDDFHTLDKQKLFALNFSATQEIDKNQQTLISEQKQLKETVKRQNDIIFELSSKIEGLMSRITQLEQMK